MNNKDTIRRIFKYISKYNIAVIISFVFSVVSVISMLYVPILIGKAIDLIIEAGNVDFTRMKNVIFQIVILIVISMITQWLHNIINNHVTYHVVKDMRVKAFNHIHDLPISYLDSHPKGDIVSRIVTDIDQFSDGLLMGFTQLFSGVVTIVVTLIFMISVNFQIAIVVVVLTPITLFVASFIAKRTYKLFRKQSESRGELTSLIDEMIGEQKVVQAFSYEERAIERFVKINDELQNDSMSATFYSSITNPTTRFINNLIYAIVAIMGALYAISGKLTIGQLTSFLSYANQYTKPFNEISNVVTELQNAFACARRVFELLDEASEIKEKTNAVVLTDTTGDVSFDNVSFSYDEEKPLLTNLNLDIKPGMRVAIVGPTGCGKSTLINLLMRFYDVNEGTIKVDSNDIKGVTRESLRASFGMVLQDTWLKNGTIKENIAYGNENATDEEIINAAKKSHAHSFIRRFPDGYDTYISEDGGNLSGGQKQLLCITRVLLNLPSMMILDEATSSIDTQTEIRIQRVFKKMMENRTSFVVTHRLSTIQESDLILVMKDGNIIERGSHEKLLAENGFYTHLFNSQFHTKSIDKGAK